METAGIEQVSTVCLADRLDYSTSRLPPNRLHQLLKQPVQTGGVRSLS